MKERMLFRSPKLFPKSEWGVAFVETVIALPLFLLLVFGCYAAAVWFNTTSSLSSAVPRAQLAAGTRGKIAVVPNQVAMMIEDWKNGDQTIPRPELLSLLVSPGLDASTAITNLDLIATSSCTSQNGSEGVSFGGGTAAGGGNGSGGSSGGGSLEGGENGHGAEMGQGGSLGGASGINHGLGNYNLCPYHHFKELPSHYILTWIYIAESMRLSVGDSLRYPWNPTDPPGLFCSFIPPNQTTAGGSSVEWSLNAVVCDIGPNIPGLGAINRLIAMLSRNDTQSAKALTITVANWTSVDNAINGT